MSRKMRGTVGKICILTAFNSEMLRLDKKINLLALLIST